MQIGKLSYYLPILGVRTYIPKYLAYKSVLSVDFKREVSKAHVRRYLADVLVFAEQQIQKRSLALAVATYKTQLPIRVYLKADVVKHDLCAAVICKSQIAYVYQRHKTPPIKKVARKSILTTLMILFCNINKFLRLSQTAEFTSADTILN